MHILRLVKNKFLKLSRELIKGNGDKEFDGKKRSFLSEVIEEENEYLINLDAAIISRYVHAFLHMSYSIHMYIYICICICTYIYNYVCTYIQTHS
jgi:hypothetical protein